MSIIGGDFNLGAHILQGMLGDGELKKFSMALGAAGTHTYSAEDGAIRSEIDYFTLAEQLALRADQAEVHRHYEIASHSPVSIT